MHEIRFQLDRSAGHEPLETQWSKYFISLGSKTFYEGYEKWKIDGHKSKTISVHVTYALVSIIPVFIVGGLMMRDYFFITGTFAVIFNTFAALYSGINSKRMYEKMFEGLCMADRHYLKEKVRNEHGATDFSPDYALESENTRGEGGIYIGGGQYWRGMGHILTVGGNRAGKGANLIVPALLSPALADYGASFICLDPKGENAHVTRNAKAGQGYAIHVLNPLGIAGLPQSRFNPFDVLDVKTSSQSDVIAFCDTLAELALPLTEGASDGGAYYTRKGRELLAAFMLYLYDAKPHSVNFGTLRSMAYTSGKALDTLLFEMQCSTAYGGVIAEVAASFAGQRSGESQKAADYTIQAITDGLTAFKNPDLVAATSATDFDVSTLVAQKTGIYVCLPQEDQSANAIWLRLVMGSLLRFVQKNYNPKRKLLFILDEFPILGHMRGILDSIGYIGGFNVTFWIIVQDYVQLQRHYGKAWESFIGNSNIKHFLRVEDVTTQKYASDLTTIDVKVITSGYAASDGRASFHGVEKRLLEPAEIRAESQESIIVFAAHLPTPVLLPREPYYDRFSPFKALADKNPLHHV